MSGGPPLSPSLVAVSVVAKAAQPNRGRPVRDVIRLA